MSDGCGSSTAASCWAARKIRLSLPSACSSARVDDGRPITNGIIMCGNTTTSRKGTMGRVSYTSNSGISYGLWALGFWLLPKPKDQGLTSLFNQRDRLVLRFDDLSRDHALAHLFLVR